MSLGSPYLIVALPFVNSLLRLQTYFFVAMACPVVRSNNTSPIAVFGVPVNGQPCALARLEPESPALAQQRTDAHPSRACSRDRMNTRPRLPAIPYTGARAHQGAMLLGGDVRQLSLEGMEKLDPTLFVFVGGLAFAQMYSRRRKCVLLGSGQFSYTRVYLLAWLKAFVINGCWSSSRRNGRDL